MDKKNNEKYEHEPEPSNDFLNKLLNKNVKVIYSPIIDIKKGTMKEGVWFEGKLTGFTKYIITLESETDFKKIDRCDIDEIFAKN